MRAPSARSERHAKCISWGIDQSELAQAALAGLVAQVRDEPGRLVDPRDVPRRSDKFRKIKRRKPRSATDVQDTLARAMGTGTGGTNHIGLVKDTLNQVLGTTWYEVKTMNDPPTQEQRDLLKRDVVTDISKGYPIVANVVSGWRPPGYPGGEIYHYVSVVGYDASGDRVLIADPAGERSGGATWCNVPRTYWISIDDLGTWIGGKGYAA